MFIACYKSKSYKTAVPVDCSGKSTGVGFVSEVITDTKRNRIPRELLNVKSLGKINHVLDVSDADVNACMTSISAVCEYDGDMIK